MEALTDAVAELVSRHAPELRDELGQLQERRERIAAELVAIDRRVAMLKGLLDVAPAPGAVEGTVILSDRGVSMTLHAAMAEVLKTAPERMMRASDLATAIERRGLYKMRDGRPVEAQQIHARVGRYQTMFTKDGTYIKLK